MSKRFCEQCGARIVIFRQINKRGRRRLVSFSPRTHSLCRRHARELFQSEMQAQKFLTEIEIPPGSFGQNRRLRQLYNEF